MFMESVNKLQPSVYQTQFPGDWWEDVGGTSLDIVWIDEIETRGDFSNFGSYFALKGDPLDTGTVVDVGVMLIDNGDGDDAITRMLSTQTSKGGSRFSCFKLKLTPITVPK